MDCFHGVYLSLHSLPCESLIFLIVYLYVISKIITFRKARSLYFFVSEPTRKGGTIDKVGMRLVQFVKTIDILNLKEASIMKEWIHPSSIIKNNDLWIKNKSICRRDGR